MDGTELQGKMQVLCNQWHTLLCHIDREYIFDYDLFKTAYLGTFDILRSVSCQRAVPKEYMDLFWYANDFATHFVTGISAEHDAAGELTGLMLNACCFECGDKLAAEWFDKESGQRYAFGDVDASVAVLAKQYEDDYA